MTAVVHTKEHRLTELEGVIERALATFVEMGSALAEIRDNELYKPNNGGGYTRFEDYCQARWGWNADYGRKLISAATVTLTLKDQYNCSDLPANEGQARPLTKLEPDDQPRAWQRAVEIATADERSVIAADVKEAVVEILQPDPEPTKPEVHKRDPRIKLIEEAIRNLRAARKDTTGLQARELGAIVKNLKRLIEEMI